MGGACNAAVIDYSRDETTCSDATMAEDAGTYGADCGACSSVLNPFAFNNDMGMAEGDQSKCLDFFVGHILNDCGAGTTLCIDEVRPTVAGRCEGHPTVTDSEASCVTEGGTWSPVPTTATRQANIGPIIDAAIAGDNGFCGYTDTACKIKIQNTIENSMTTIGVMGGIFLLFFLGIIFFTEQGIVIYKAAATTMTMTMTTPMSKCRAAA